MSIFNRFFKISRAAGNEDNHANDKATDKRRRDSWQWDKTKYAFIDTEIGLKDHKIHDIGAISHNGAIFHEASSKELVDFLKREDIHFVCGHNIVNHDAKYLFGYSSANGSLAATVTDGSRRWLLVDTLYFSPLLFPERPYHRLVKDDKLLCDELNNPVNDCMKARELLYDEEARWNSLSPKRQKIFASLLRDRKEFVGFLTMMGAQGLYTDTEELADIIREEYDGKICSNAEIRNLAISQPCAMAYALSLIDTTDRRSITPGWVLHNFPEVEYVIRKLRHCRCEKGCRYCNESLDVGAALKENFGYDKFRSYNNEPLQENATRAAVDGKSLLAIFPTGGGKSLTFQLPALMAGKAVHGLTVVISPLQSLMKDQVDNLANRGITDAVTINGLLDPINRSLAIERVTNGDASLLYIAPEMLRSKTIERILGERHVTRFVIDEAHCFSAWGQDFRVDYQYIGKFIKEYQKRKGGKLQIPISCFTATAKQKVVQDICDYFKHWLGVELQLFATSATRTNLRYSVIHVDTENDKYNRLRTLVRESECPTIIYVSRTKRTRQLAEKLTRDGIPALPYNGKMDSEEKIQNQEAFMNDRVRTIVATSAFGMGVDKSDVGLVVHYDISDSLENYVQEAGRAGRDPNLNARCFVLYSDNDLDKHFILLNQTKLSISEIQQVWQAVKDFTKQRQHISCSALEIARQAGWDDSINDIETRVRTALNTLEQSGYIERGNNIPHVYATGITVKNMDEARKRITESSLFTEKEKDNVARIIKSLISQKNIAKAQDSEAESRIDYLADILGLSKKEIISAVIRMRQEGILADTRDMSAYMNDIGDTQKKSRNLLDNFARLERFIISHITEEPLHCSYKQLNEEAINEGIDSSSEKVLRTLLYFLVVKGYTLKKQDKEKNIIITRLHDLDFMIKRFERRIKICHFIIDRLYAIAEKNEREKESKPTEGRNTVSEKKAGKGSVQFSVIEMLDEYNRSTVSDLFTGNGKVQLEDVEEALLYLSKTGALKLEGGFLVLYNAMDIHRLKEMRMRYKKEDYQALNEFYKQKMQQIHIVGEYANLMVRNYDAALKYVQDYFQMDYRLFVEKYFNGKRKEELEHNLTPMKYRQLFGNLSLKQKEIIKDRESKCIVVAAGPGSGKTRVLVHKLASLLLLEDVKHEQLLMLTFSRAAATEFKQRLMQLIGNAAHFVEIKTFHSYSFDLLGRIGNLNDAADVVKKAADMIRSGEVEPNRIRKTVLVIDEAQDMSDDDFALVDALMRANEEMRVIAVGDDDQNIYEFRGSNSHYMEELGRMQGSRFIEMTENYRSSEHVVDAVNDFAPNISYRLKTAPIISMKKEKGMVSIIKHPPFFQDKESGEKKAVYMFLPIVNDILQNNRQGKTCILTQTNEEAVITVALLHENGLNAKLIQSMDGLRFWNIAEVRYFVKCIDRMQKTTRAPIITEDIWEEAKSKTLQKYSTSNSLPYLKRCIMMFELMNKAKYYTDLRDFLFESSVEDFCDVSDADIVVSTIHKAKGREFDNVIMLVVEPEHYTDDIMRRLYVGMSRTKLSLTIHTNGKIFDDIRADKRISDPIHYPMPDEIELQLSHKDVNLGAFKEHKKTILSLRSGDTLAYHDYHLSLPSTGTDIGLLSMNMQKKMLQWQMKGYLVTRATVRFVVAWRPKEAANDEKESAILLIDLKLKRNSQQRKVE